MPKPRVLLLAENCNPEWPSLPIVGYKYARALSRVADVRIATHVRNRPNIEAAGELGRLVTYIDNEWIAAGMYRAAKVLRGGSEVAWSTNQMMAYLPYLEFERRALAAFRSDLKAGAFDLVHRITPMSPTLPSLAAGRIRVPFVIGPLNGNLDWPRAFASEQQREREGLRRLRDLYKLLPYARSTYSRAAAILAAFRHTAGDLPAGVADRVVPFPEIGFDPEVFHPGDRRPPFAGAGPFAFVFAGRLVPYKLPEAAVRAFVASEALKPHRLHILGDGPEEPRLRRIVAEAGAGERVIFEGRKSQGRGRGLHAPRRRLRLPLDPRARRRRRHRGDGLRRALHRHRLRRPGRPRRGRARRAPAAAAARRPRRREPRRDGGLPRRPPPPMPAWPTRRASTPFASTPGRPRPPSRCASGTPSSPEARSPASTTTPEARAPRAAARPEAPRSRAAVATTRPRSSTRGRGRSAARCAGCWRRSGAASARRGSSAAARPGRPRSS